MRIGHRAELVPVMFRRLMIGCLANLDGEEIVGNLALVHHDIGINRFSELIIGGDNRSVRQPQRPLAQPVVIAIDLPARELLFEMHRQPVRQRALAEILRKQEGLARIEFAERAQNLVQRGLHLGLHVVSVKNILGRGTRGGSTVARSLTSALRSAAVPARRCPPPARRRIRRPW